MVLGADLKVIGPQSKMEAPKMEESPYLKGLRHSQTSRPELPSHRPKILIFSMAAGCFFWSLQLVASFGTSSIASMVKKKRFFSKICG
jgi:hypothetical protein